MIIDGLRFIRQSKRFKVVRAGVCLGWIQDYYGINPHMWTFRMSPNAYLLCSENLMTIAGFLDTINQVEDLNRR